MSGITFVYVCWDLMQLQLPMATNTTIPLKRCNSWKTAITYNRNLKKKITQDHYRTEQNRTDKTEQ